VASRNPGSLASQLGDAIGRLNTRLRRDVVDAGVSLARARTLGTLEREGPRRLTDLAVVEEVAQPTMSALVAALEANGLVSRRGDSADGRTVVVSITDKGRRCLGRIRDRRSSSLQQSLANLSSEDRAAIAAAIPALAHLLEKMDERQAIAALR
jgi:DNA-binding MarR family transcriptional regulator